MHETNLYTITIPPILKSLDALSKLLDKAEAHAGSKKTERLNFEAALLDERIVFDQFPFIRQIQIACDNAKGAAARLAEIDNPKYADDEKTIADLKARIEKTIEFVKSVSPEKIIGKEDIHVSLPYWNNKYLSGFEYATEYLMPNFYFHVTTAYAILRKNGIDIGKDNFINGLPLK